MKKIILLLLGYLILLNIMKTNACDRCHVYDNEDFNIVSSKLTYNSELEEIVISLKVKGTAGATTPDSLGKLNGSGILTYLFMTSLNPMDVGFGETEGMVALAVASHPDVDYSPLWDENNNGNYADDGKHWQAHWILLVKDERVKGGYSVKEIKNNTAINMPTTAAYNVPLYLDSPGFQVITKNNTVKVVIPVGRINRKTNFQFEIVTGYMLFNTTDNSLPMLGLVNVYDRSSKEVTFFSSR